jgi:hypothetical protein
MTSSEFDEIDEILSGEYITMGQNERKVMKFYRPSEIKPEEVEKPYNDTITKKVRFIVQDPAVAMKQRKFDVGKRSARLIVAEFKQGNYWLEVQKTGSGKDTLYIPRAVQAPPSVR